MDDRRVTDISGGGARWRLC